MISNIYIYMYCTCIYIYTYICSFYKNIYIDTYSNPKNIEKRETWKYVLNIIYNLETLFGIVLRMVIHTFYISVDGRNPAPACRWFFKL